MRCGLSLPNGGVCGDVRLLAELGCLAEKAGWEGVFVEVYIVHQSDGAVPTCDPWIALAAIAVGTSRVRLGTSVTPLSRRRPWKVAREAVTLDQLSNGRFILVWAQATLVRLALAASTRCVTPKSGRGFWMRRWT